VVLALHQGPEDLQAGVVVAALPRTASGKLRRTELRAALVGAARGGDETPDDAEKEAGA
jgi:acyl-coenzyme A synthetase/AMP-(fatty) acid ligase